MDRIVLESGDLRPASGDLSVCSTHSFEHLGRLICGLIFGGDTETTGLP
jgi:hypothetical protein